MRKTALIALISFFAGLILAAVIFVYQPQKNTGFDYAEKSASQELSANIYASENPNDQTYRANLDFASIAEKISPAVVYIEAEKVEKVRQSGFFEDSPFDFWERFFGTPPDRDQEQRSRTSGSGFFISDDGFIVTNNHVVENAVEVTVLTLSNKQLKAEIIGTDPETDLALIKVEEKGTPFARLGDSDNLKVGDWVLAIGNPLGMNHTVTAGIVSAKGRLIPSLNLAYQDFIQTDAAINSGNSGGPLINMTGEVIGINTLIFAPTGGNIGIGFSISSKIANKVIPQLKENKRVVRGWLGISATAITADIVNILESDDSEGAYIVGVEPGSPAEKADLEVYDVIKAVDGVPIEDANDLSFRIAEVKPGTKIKLTIIRDGKEKIVEVKIAEKDQGETKEETSSSDKGIGISVQAMTERLARRYGYQRDEGLIILEIERNSQAARSGLRRGDIIIEVNRKQVKTVKDLERIIDDTKPGGTLLMRVWRERVRDEFMVTLRISE